MWWRYILAGVILTVPVFLYFGMKWLGDILPLPLFIAIGAIGIYAIYKLACWMDRAGWKP